MIAAHVGNQGATGTLCGIVGLKGIVLAAPKSKPPSGVRPEDWAGPWEAHVWREPGPMWHRVSEFEKCPTCEKIVVGKPKDMVELVGEVDRALAALPAEERVSFFTKMRAWCFVCGLKKSDCTESSGRHDR